ncbi:3-oxoacyl-[acyl-carrier-protein] synthase III C-terminal domain-containing protein [Ascidiimonas sp. W6]|uniref:3-oxoacyl-[acyl-carrier-protein] synthase III C-terminal domain-containing protein n=1 Tax=Ascidiimonas meishanensis TaxID=3128903 RepID=UPI0030EFA348
MKQTDVYIAEVQSIFPKSYDAVYFADRVYPKEIYGERTNQLAKRLASSFGVQKRPSVLDFDAYPNVLLKQEKDHPRKWGVSIIDKLTKYVDKDEIGMFNLSYNATYHTDILPNLACQIALDAELKELDTTEELPYYGCAAGIYSLSDAIEYCKHFDRPAIVFVFDQCTVKMTPLAADDEDFSKTLVSNLLFNDGGIGILVIPERMKKRFNHPVMKVADTAKYHTPGGLIKMKNGKFMMDTQLKDVVPKLVSEKLIKPFMKKNKVEIADIEEWSIHQGGTKVIKQFTREDHLGLPETKIKPSIDAFYKYGNTSAPSCLYVLESFFNKKETVSIGTKGLLIGFGAGYYMAALKYSWK